MRNKDCAVRDENGEFVTVAYRLARSAGSPDRAPPLIRVHRDHSRSMVATPLIVSVRKRAPARSHVCYSQYAHRRLLRRISQEVAVWLSSTCSST